MIHAIPHNTLQTTLDWDEETFYYAPNLQKDIDKLLDDRKLLRFNLIFSTKKCVL